MHQESFPNTSNEDSEKQYKELYGKLRDDLKLPIGDFEKKIDGLNEDELEDYETVLNWLIPASQWGNEELGEDENEEITPADVHQGNDTYDREDLIEKLRYVFEAGPIRFIGHSGERELEDNSEEIS